VFAFLLLLLLLLALGGGGGGGVVGRAGRRAGEPRGHLFLCPRKKHMDVVDAILAAQPDAAWWSALSAFVVRNKLAPADALAPGVRARRAQALAVRALPHGRHADRARPRRRRVPGPGARNPRRRAPALRRRLPRPHGRARAQRVPAPVRARRPRGRAAARRRP